MTTTSETFCTAPSDSSHPITYYAPSERKTNAEIEEDIVRVTNNPVIGGAMTVANGLLAVLNEQRQVVALNDAFMKRIGVTDAGEVLGLRNGEILQCVHAREMAGGCGTSRWCRTCGAVIATMASLSTAEPQEGTCALTVERDNQQVDLYFNVRTYPLEMSSSRYVLLFMQDVTIQQHRACLDRTFFHDINNVLCALIGKARIASRNEGEKNHWMADVEQLAKRVAHEISIHNSLQKSMDLSIKPIYAEVTVNTMLGEVDHLFQEHPVAAGKKVIVTYREEDTVITTDRHLASRVLVNMMTNALEATEEGCYVTLTCAVDDSSVTFEVWNDGEIPEDVVPRIFQLNYSTKGITGRGFGTYSMKLLGENILGGTVSFDTGKETGTTFNFTLPQK